MYSIHEKSNIPSQSCSIFRNSVRVGSYKETENLKFGRLFLDLFMKPRMSATPSFSFVLFKKENLEDISPFCGVTFVDFW